MDMQYVRDCLEVLRLGAGLDNGKRVRRGKMDEWKYVYLEQGDLQNYSHIPADHVTYNPWAADSLREKEKANEGNPNAGLTRKSGVDWELPINLREPLEYHRSEELDGPCDPDHPRVFHMFWTGPFTDKPYLALLSYLFTQNVGLHDGAEAMNDRVCRPQFWMWINPGPAAASDVPPSLRALRETEMKLPGTPAVWRRTPRPSPPRHGTASRRVDEASA